MAIADVFDALTSDRVYRKAFPVEEAVQMMREQRGRHFDPVLLDAFMEVLDDSGPDAREKERADPGELVESTLETYGTALERGDAETAEGAIAQAIEDGIPATTLHGEVLAPALLRIRELRAAGEIDGDRERLAKGITRRVLATLYRYMIGNAEPTRERVLLAGMEGDEHALELQMMHDQIAAAGFETVFEGELSSDSLVATAACADSRRDRARRDRRRGPRGDRPTLSRSCTPPTPRSRFCSAAPRSAARRRRRTTACGCSSASTRPSKRSRSSSPRVRTPRRCRLPA